VQVIDPHSYVSSALINKVIPYSARNHINRAISECIPDMLFYPDEGSCKRYSSDAQKEYAFGIKRRNWETGKIEGLEVAGCIDKIKDSNILIVDDICSRGGTFLHSARKLKELGANKIYLYVTHCENTILEGELLEGDLIEKVFTTNSIFTKSHEKIEVFEL
jgi:ribose-phosphate pyrophosphokinase